MKTTIDSNQPGIERVSYADEPLPENLALALVVPDTKERAKLAALTAIATPVTIERRDILLGRAAQITAITSDEQAATATEIAGLLKGLRNSVEDARKRLKEPVLDIGRAIDGTAQETIAAGVAELKRLERLVGDYAAEKERARLAERRRIEEDARRAQAEAERIAREAQQAEEKARQEAAAIASKANAGEADLLDAMDAEAKAEEAAARASAAVAQAAAPVYAPIVPAETTKVSGAAVAKDWDYEVTDIAALYAVKPECVELKPRAAVIKAVIKAAAQQAGGNSFTIPGLRIAPKFNVATRAR